MISTLQTRGTTGFARSPLPPESSRPSRATAIRPTTATGFRADAAIGSPSHLAVDSAGNVFVFDIGANRVRRIDALTGIITSVAGNGWWGYTGDGGPATEARVGVNGMAIGANGDLFLGDPAGGYVCWVSAATGIITSILGNGTYGFCGESAPRLEACLFNPFAVAVNAQGNLFISDSGNYRIRRSMRRPACSPLLLASPVSEIPAVTSVRRSTRVSAARRKASRRMRPAISTSPGGFDHRIRRIDAVSRIITTIAGTGAAGTSGDGGLATAARINDASYLIFDAAGNLYFSYSGAHRVRKIAATATGLITTVAGWGNPNGALGDGGPATSGALNLPKALAIDAAGNLLIGDANNARIRKVTVATGIHHDVCRQRHLGRRLWRAGDGGDHRQPARDRGGRLRQCLAHLENSLRRIDATTGIITSVARGPSFATADGLKPEDAVSDDVRPAGQPLRRRQCPRSRLQDHRASTSRDRLHASHGDPAVVGTAGRPAGIAAT